MNVYRLSMGRRKVPKRYRFDDYLRTFLEELRIIL